MVILCKAITDILNSAKNAFDIPEYNMVWASSNGFVNTGTGVIVWTQETLKNVITKI